MVEGAAWKRRLAAVGGQADNPAAALGTQMRQYSTYKLDRPEEICGELVSNLLVGKFFRRAEETIACVADDYIDLSDSAKALSTTLRISGRSSQYS